MDGTWFRDVHSFEQQTSWLHTAMRWDAKYGVLVFAALILIGYLIARRAPDAPYRVAVDVWTPLAALVAVGIAQPIGDVVQRQRPFVAMHLHPLVPHAADYGFPSDHATAVGAVATGLWLVNKWLGGITTLLALLLAFSRVYIGVHYPGDVAGGLALGAVVTLLGVVVVVPLLRWIVVRLAHTPLRPLVAAPSARIPQP